jgi:hypothetical protein
VPALYPAGRVFDRLPHNHLSLLITPSQPHLCTESLKVALAWGTRTSWVSRELW